MIKNKYISTIFLKSVKKMILSKKNNRMDVAFSGYSNSGKSTAINLLSNQKKLARTSKKPGSTKTINLFQVDFKRYLIDLPGYGYSKTSKKTQLELRDIVFYYLKNCFHLKGLIIFMDIRHPLKKIDYEIINLVNNNNIPIAIFLTKSDKISKNLKLKTIKYVNKTISLLNKNILVYTFSKYCSGSLLSLLNVVSKWHQF
ncbi:ribosome biogenesis GTP-binding protein YihA/YsxC [Buchnera aphidicola (Kurisakia onigurumii)]|uniref:ribosome biogenesis GTP-binding protein YihA/YsxC n=1 Tax=Buchnera aphidicola TaxID=9 RepID=UPI0031B67D72